MVVRCAYLIGALAVLSLLSPCIFADIQSGTAFKADVAVASPESADSSRAMVRLAQRMASPAEQPVAANASIEPVSIAQPPSTGNATSSPAVTDDRPLFRSSATQNSGSGWFAPKNSTTTDASSGGIIQTLGALGVVIALVLLLRAGYQRFTGRPAAGAGTGVVEVLARCSVAPRNQIMLVRLGRRILAVSDSPAGMRTLANIDDPEEVAGLLTAISASRPNSITKGFASLMSRVNEDYDREQVQEEGGDDAEHHVDRARDSVSGLLSRVRSLAGREGSK